MNRMNNCLILTQVRFHTSFFTTLAGFEQFNGKIGFFYLENFKSFQTPFLTRDINTLQIKANMQLPASNFLDTDELITS